MGDTIKSGRKESFTVLYNSMITDPRLSLKAKGLFAVMMSRPENWEFSVSGLAAFVGVGKDSIRSTLAELEEVGYLLRSQAHDSAGHFSGNVYVLQDIAPPLSGKPDDGETRQRENQSSGNPTQRNNDYKERKTKEPPIVPQEGDGCAGTRKMEKTVPKWKPERFEALWSYYREHARGENRQGAAKAWDKLKPNDALIDTMARALMKQVASEDWKRGVGIPYLSTWLNNSRWTDDKKAASPEPLPQNWEDRFGWK